jgi:transcriptional regulator with XRE-family HTH domain
MGEIVPKISELRDRQKLTQRELAEAVGVTETTIANWEKGRSATEWFVRIDRLCKALGVSPGDLYEDKEVGSKLT